jgi:uncharacterized protein
MSASLYEATAARFEQTLTALTSVLAKGREHCAEQDINLDGVLNSRLYPDMLPLSFQVVSSAHHSAGALAAARSGEFAPPPRPDDVDYAALETCMADALAAVQSFKASELHELEDNDLVFRLGKNELPFKVGDFLLSFSIPNFFFHATTTYDLLRMQGVPIGKRDFLGRMLMKT